jgi:hypothetical protein
MTKKSGRYVVRTNQPPINIIDNKAGTGFITGSFIQLKSVSFVDSKCCNQPFISGKNAWEGPQEVFCPPDIKDGRWSDKWRNVNDISKMLFRAFSSPNPNGIPIGKQSTVVPGDFSGLGPFLIDSTLKRWTAYPLSGPGVTLSANFKKIKDFPLNNLLSTGGWYFGWSNSDYSAMFLYNNSLAFSYTGWKAYFVPAKGTEGTYTPGCIDNFNKNTIVDLQDCGTTQANCPPLSQPDTPSPHSPHPPSPHSPHPPSPHSPHPPSPHSPHPPSPQPLPPGPSSPTKNGLSTVLIIGIVGGIILLLLSTVIFIKFR